ncbi:histone-lysine N-methyltransferase ASHH2 isoform X2 [Gossypium arboreum]|uniref:histone-lysine N-methyltransferase ASHH2 isoform X2 n=1 Tax=Gossypium arboreum TaxID=29729 RepID=UPI0008190ACB|nr:histone-lysine N-methyltransferase ASHH2 isoform X2 [Gossypium arboreum]
MCLCESTALVNEPLSVVASAEQHSCSESMENLVPEPRDCIISDSSGDSTGNRYDDTVIYLEENRGESDGDSAGYSCENHCENVDCSGLKELLGARIDDHVACLNVSQGKIDVHNSENDQLCLENRLFSGKYVPTAINGSLGLSQDEFSACLSSGTEIETEICNRIQSVKDSNLTLESIAIAGCRSGCAQQNGQNDNNIVRGPLLDWKNCASSMIKSVTSSEISAICCAQTLSSLQGSGDSVSSCDWLNQKDEMSSRDFSLEGFNKAVETKSIGDTYSELLASKGCASSFETLHSAESLCTKQNAQTDNKNFIVLSGDSVAKVSEERTGIAAGAKVETSSEIMNAGDSFELSENSLCDKLVSLSCHPFDIVENGLSGRLDPPDCLTKGAYAALNSSSSIDFCGQRQNEGKVVVKADCVSEVKHHPTESSSPRRGGRKDKSSQKTNAKTRNCRNKLQLPPESIELHFRASRRKRSCSSRPGRSSIQELFSNITQFLEPCDDPEFNEVQNQKPSNARDGQGSRKSCKDQSGQSIKGSGGLSKSSTSCLRFRIKVGKGVGPSNLNSVVAEVVNLPVSVDTSYSIYGKGTGLQFPKLANVAEDKVGELGIERQFLNKEDQEKVKTCLDASFMDLKLTNNVSGSAEYLKKSAEDALGDYLVSKPNAVAESSGRAIDNKYSGSGTSPDSLVINSIPDAQVGLIHQEELHDPALNNSGFLASPGGVKSSKVSKKGKKDNHRSPRTVCLRKPKSSNNCRGRTKTRDNEFISNKAISSSAGANSSRGNGLGVSEESMKMDISMDAKACCSHHVPETKKFKNLSSSKDALNQLSKSSKSQAVRKGGSKVSDSAGSRKGNACKQWGGELKSVSKIKVKEKGSNQEIVTRGGKHPLTGNHISVDFENSDTGNSSASAYMINIDSVSDVIKQHTQPDNAWVCCDDCHKWRRIPVTLLNSIDEACRWICGDNTDKTFADCSIPQEKSNADINAELGVSDAEEDGCDGLNYKEFEKGFNNKRVTVPPPSHFWRIDSNKFLHRGCKTQTIDEIMICHCKRPPDGNLGCGDECLNRMLNIECVQDTCPCGELCSNQQFQKRKYAKMMWDRFGRKGFGLRMLENISAGQFLIEYVGEVLDMQAYEARQKEYASRGQRHFYFMTLNGSEVIDAYVKGNLGRFINHSCDPNCRTEKWMVNGEICIGLFALRDIKKGEEITFDYNYVRVFGAAAKKCHCGSSHCRGYIGGDSLSEGVIVYDDSDEESPEPMMLEDGETWNGYANVISRYSPFVGAEMQPVERVITYGVRKLEKVPEAEGSVYHSASASSKLDISAEIEDLQGNFQLPIQPEEVSPLAAPYEAVQQDDTIEHKAMKKTSRLIHILDTSLNMSDNKLPSVIIDANKESKFNTAEDKQVPPKSHPLMKTSCLSSSHKKGKLSSNSLNGTKVRMISEKSQVPAFKLKKFLESSSSCRFEAVEEKLNELLDSEGGITKRKDASKGYLKLLLLTATSGDSANGEAIQSTRELSMILDALLKTKSRLVLTDIIDKNGLQMLHNIMKKYRRDFNKIPVLRKLLKVLEYLARRKILTVERINGGPPCAGRESFLESILSFTEHNDKTVHEIARNFRDTWIPKPLRKHSYRDKVERRMELRRYLGCNRVSASHNHLRDQAIRSTEAITVVKTTTLDNSHEICSSSPTGVCQTNGTKIRKRKSRWDQPAETEKIDSRSPKKHEYSQLTILGKPTSNHMNKMSRWDKECHDILCKGEAVNVVNGKHRFQGDAPLGFSSPCSASLVSSTAALTATSFPQPKTCQLKCPEMTIAHPQTRLISRLPVSYGIPLPIVQQFGAPKDESVESWAIAPGMPFHPYPPLPPSPCPHGKKDTPPVCAANSIGNNEDAKDEQQDCCRPATSYPDNSIRSTARCNEPNSEIPCANIQRTSKRTRESSNDLGKYFRQQKRKGPPWHKSESTGSKDNNIGGTSFLDVGNVKNDVRNS